MRLLAVLLASVIATGCTAAVVAPTPSPSPSTAPSAVPTPAARYTIEQAISDRAQANTIAFDALGFLTGTLGADSFFPPGKVADFWGFQYLRDNDPSEMGHNTDFLTRASFDTLAILSAEQRGRLITLARAQVPSIKEYGTKRFVLMAAFRRLLQRDLPSGTTGLDLAAVKAYSASLYQVDAKMSLERAAVMGSLLAALTPAQRASLDAMVGKGMTSWPVMAEPADLAGLDRDVKEAVMTYAGDMLSWYAGSIEADTYFCPERHGTYFGSFYLKDAPAVGNPGYSIDTRITADLGASLLAQLDTTQAALITGLVETQRQALTRIVDTRRAVSTELRKAMSGAVPNAEAVGALMGTYGELDGEISFTYATSFATVGQSLSPAQRAGLVALRDQLLGGLALPLGAYLFSEPIAMPQIPSTDFLFR